METCLSHKAVEFFSESNSTPHLKCKYFIQIVLNSKNFVTIHQKLHCKSHFEFIITTLVTFYL